MYRLCCFDCTKSETLDFIPRSHVDYREPTDWIAGCPKCNINPFFLTGTQTPSHVPIPTNETPPDFLFGSDQEKLFLQYTSFTSKSKAALPSSPLLDTEQLDSQELLSPA
jgi:hypothetical protein